MKNTIYGSLLISFVFLFFAQKGFSQNPDSSKQKQQYIFYRKTLQIDSLKALEIVKIQDSYKQEMKILLADPAMNEEQKRLRIKKLIASKNKKLCEILTVAQQEKIIPTTERDKFN